MTDRFRNRVSRPSPRSSKSVWAWQVVSRQQVERRAKLRRFVAGSWLGKLDFSTLELVPARYVSWLQEPA